MGLGPGSPTTLFQDQRLAAQAHVDALGRFGELSQRSMPETGAGEDRKTS